ncbi:hydrogenase maturation nickel metallochaperone HypA [Thermodesulfobacteriota bacterium]
MSIAQSVVDIVKDEMAKNNAIKLKSVRLNIGRMTAVIPDAFSFCFKIITDKTELEGAELIMDIVPLRGYCHTCEKEFEIEGYAFSCPTCGDKTIETVSGQDLSIVEIEVE